MFYNLLIGMICYEFKSTEESAFMRFCKSFGRVVTVEWHQRDRYQRIIGKVLINGQDANLEQIRTGLAWHYSRYARNQAPGDRERYALAEDQARRAGLDLWRDAAPVPPWDFRRK